MLFLDTCNCDRDLFINWYENPPYTIVNAQKELSGLFPPMVKDMMNAACGICTGYKTSKFNFKTSKTGHEPQKSNVQNNCVSD